MHEDQLKQRIAKLESANDQLSAEIRFLDEISRKLGFEHGLKTLKAAALELLDEQQNETF
jgi:transposase